MQTGTGRWDVKCLLDGLEISVKVAPCRVPLFACSLRPLRRPGLVPDRHAGQPGTTHANLPLPPAASARRYTTLFPCGVTISIFLFFSPWKTVPGFEPREGGAGTRARARGGGSPQVCRSLGWSALWSALHMLYGAVKKKDRSCLYTSDSLHLHLSSGPHSSCSAPPLEA